MNIDWKRKLTSRKFWMAVISLVTSIVMIAGGSDQQAQQIAGVILQAATVLAYCIGEGMADSITNVNVAEENHDEN
ncbi:MAG: hypothetical protein UHU21_05650 [Lachnospiraceae bacterium]|nr:hypothetical protein [Lachnospiraceae bacterium]